MKNVRPLDWAVHDDDGEIRARCAAPEEAAALIAFLGDGSTIRHGNAIVWREGTEDEPAAESFDHVAQTCYDRATANSARRALRAMGDG